MPPFTALMMPSNVVKYIIVILANVSLRVFPELRYTAAKRKRWKKMRISTIHNRIEGQILITSFFALVRAKHALSKMPLLSAVCTVWEEEVKHLQKKYVCHCEQFIFFKKTTFYMA